MKVKYILSFIFALIIITAAIFIFFQYVPISDVIEEESKSDKDNGSVSVGNISFKEAVNAFAFDIFRELNKNNEGNIFISPYSIFTALAMTYEGAKNETADEMAGVLSIEQDNASFHNYIKNLYDLLNSKKKDYNISTANALWVQENYKLLESFLNLINTYYGGSATEVNFGNPEKAAEIINQWVENNTNGLIKDLILPEYLDDFTRLILINTIYFKSMWKFQFDTANTTDRDFDNEYGITIQVPTMRLLNTENAFNYIETDDLQILELPYTGNDLSMIILLPKDNNLLDMINKIDDNSFSEWKDTMYETNLDIYLPKFKVESSYNLNEYLINLGMVIPFNPYADFSGINGVRSLYIDKVLHKAYIDVNEEGTEAAAATAVIMREMINGGTIKIVFDCDHPFMYIIQHKQTGSILFMGSINDPLI